MYYVNKTGQNHGNPMNQPFFNSVALPDNLLSDYLITRGFCDITIGNDIITTLTINQEALDAYLAEYPDVEPEKPTTIADLKQENKLLKAQVQAASDRSDFLEDCIAEMATLVYNAEETT